MNKPDLLAEFSLSLFSVVSAADYSCCYVQEICFLRRSSWLP